ncbi:unnamed protein product [Pleuronectes platessa]|uniref:Uncharacterized protein n=1 Tax=Pleuronectes platessa TaxID=8262 RepID=A0A9N7V151_PLEPL|nr:unnamed protein product [Pleuronectes platessa]
MSSGCWLHVSSSLLLDLSVFVYAVLHVAALAGSSGDLAEKQSLRSGSGSLGDVGLLDPCLRLASVSVGGSGSRLLCGGLDPGCTRAAHCEVGDGPADFTHLRAGHVSPVQGSPRLQGMPRSPAAADSLSCDAGGGEAEEEEGGERAAPYNLCGPYRFDPRTPSCTNRCRSPAARCRLRRSL